MTRTGRGNAARKAKGALTFHPSRTDGEEAPKITVTNLTAALSGMESTQLRSMFSGVKHNQVELKRRLK